MHSQAEARLRAALATWPGFEGAVCTQADVINVLDSLEAMRGALTLAVDALAGGLWDYGPGQDEHDKCNEVLAKCRDLLTKDDQ